MADQTRSGLAIIPLTDGNVQVGGYILDDSDVAKINAELEAAKKNANTRKAKKPSK